MVTFYNTLGVASTATQAEIKSAYRKLIKQYHPDRNPNSQEATERTQLINQAYTILKDPVKRYEYDSLLRLRKEPEPTAQQQTYSTVKETPQEVPHYHCEMCGRQDPSLRVTIFLWVVSVLYMTWKRGWGKILCSHCRIKYSLLWNLEVFFAGWWSLWGPIFTIEALFKNSSGGVQPEENNASLLNILAYDFYLQGRYDDAYDTINESQKLTATKEGAEFLNYLRQYIKPKEAVPFKKKISNLHPAFYNIPIIALLLIVSVSILSSLDWSSSRSSSRNNYVPTVQLPTKEIAPSVPDYIQMASKYGINTEEINNSAKVCNEAIAKVASHIKSKVPFVGTTYEGTSQINNYELDRDKLDDKIVHPQTEIIYAELLKTSSRMKKLTVSSSLLQTPDDSIKIKIHGYLFAQYKAIIATYFDCAILEYSIPTVNLYYSNDSPPLFYINKVKQLGNQPDVSAWLRKNQYGKAYQHLLDVISNIYTKTSRVSKMRTDLSSLKTQIEEAKQSLEVVERRLNNYENQGMTDEYNNLVPSYNSQLSSSKRRIQEYNDSIEQYNLLIKTKPDTDLDGAFNSCLDPRILFASYARVDLQANKSLRNKYQ
jgi:hypothetical protein